TGAIRRGERVDPTVGTLVGEAALICGGVGDAVQSAVPVPAKGRFAPVGIVNFGYLPGLLGGAGLIKKRVGAAVGVNDIFDAKCVVYVVRVGRIYKGAVILISYQGRAALRINPLRQQGMGQGVNIWRGFEAVRAAEHEEREAEDVLASIRVGETEAATRIAPKNSV